MKEKRPSKIRLASELWKMMPTASRDEFNTAFKKKHGVTISAPASYYAKRLAGIIRKKKADRSPPTLDELKAAKIIASAHGGVDALLNKLEELGKLASPVGGIDQLKRLLIFLKELIA